MADNGPSRAAGAGAPPNVHLWSRDGFLGRNAIALRQQYTPAYLSVSGPLAPRRIDLSDIATADLDDGQALGTTIMRSRGGLELILWRRQTPTPYTIRNAEADELHFVQFGRVRFNTDFGSIEAGPLDMVMIPRSISYRIEPLSADLLMLTLASPDPLRFDTPAPFGMINFGRHVRRAQLAEGQEVRTGPHVLLIRGEDGVTQFEMADDPLAALRQVGGEPPVWALNLADVTPISYGEVGGPPAQFLSTADTGVMVYTLSARPGGRPPVHHNADYDEIILYAAGPGAWGKISKPGTLTWVPKAVTHQGPIENVPEGYQALLIEVRPNMRFTTPALEKSALMETGEYGFQNA